MSHTERERAIQKARSRALWVDAPGLTAENAESTKMKTDITHCHPPHINHSYLYGRCQFCEVLRRDVVAAQKAKRALRSATAKHREENPPC